MFSIAFLVFYMDSSSSSDLSGSENSSSSESDFPGQEFAENGGIRPYRYEPENDQDHQEGEDRVAQPQEEDVERRLGNCHW